MLTCDQGASLKLDGRFLLSDVEPDAHTVVHIGLAQIGGTLMLFLDVASIVCFAFASGMVFVLHVVEKPAYVLTGLRADMPESPENRLQLMQTKNVLGQLLAARVPQIKAGLLVAGTICSAILVFRSRDLVSLRGLLVLYGIVFIPIMAKTALPPAHRLAAVSPTAMTAELSAALGPLLRANRIGTLATVSFLVFSILVSWLE